MIRGAIALVALIVAVGAVAIADGEIEVDRAFREAQRRAAANDPAAIDAFEAIGTARPVSSLTDDAWAEAARLAERAGQLDRARRDLDHVIEVGTDEQLLRRSRGALERLSAITGAGTWDAIAAQHERLVAQIAANGNPQPAIAALEAVVRAHPDYPRANIARITIAQGWEREGDRDRALAWLEQAATHEPGQHAHLELVRGLIRADEIGRARSEIEGMARLPGADRASLEEVRHSLGRAELRAWIRHALWAVLGVLLVFGMLVLRRDVGSWKRAARQLARPPIEVIFLVPIAAILVVVAHTGNPLVARAVRSIAIAGVVIAWLSGVLLEAARSRTGRVGARRAIVQAVVAVIGVSAATYVAIDRDRMIDMVIETWREGPAIR